MVELRYVWKTLNEAMGSLSCIDKPLRERLGYAWLELNKVDRYEVEEFFGGDESRLDKIRQVYEGLDPENGGPQDLDDVQAHDVAESLLSVYDEVTRRMGSRSGS